MSDNTPNLIREMHRVAVECDERKDYATADLIRYRVIPRIGMPTHHATALKSQQPLPDLKLPKTRKRPAAPEEVQAARDFMKTPTGKRLPNTEIARRFNLSKGTVSRFRKEIEQE